MANENKDIIRVHTTAALMSSTLIAGQWGMTTDTNQLSSKKLSDSSMRFFSDDSKQMLLASAQTVTGSKTFSATSIFNAAVTVNAALTADSLNINSTITLVGTIDDDTMATATNTNIATSESIKAYIDTQVAGFVLNIIGDSGTGSINLGTQSFTIAGTANEIETTASSQTLTIGLPDNVSITGNLTVDSTTLFVDSTNNRVGVGTITPEKTVEVFGSNSGLLEALQLTNDDWGAGELTQSIAINFKLSQGGVSNKDAARITVGKDDDWDDEAATDSYMGVKLAKNGTLTEFFRMTSGPRFGFGTNSPEKLVDVLGSADNAGLEALQLTNDDWATSETGQSVSINFKLSRGGSVNRNAGRIVIGKTDDWDDAAASDSYMGLYTTKNDTLSEHVRLDHNGNLGVGILSSIATKLHVKNSTGSLPATDSATIGIFQNNATSGTNCNISIIAGTSGNSRLNFGDDADENASYLQHNHGNQEFTLFSENDLILEGNEVLAKSITGFRFNDNATDVATFNDALITLLKPVDVTGDVDITGALDVSTTATIAGALQADSLSTNGTDTFDFEKGSFTITSNGFSGTDPTGTCFFERYGNLVYLKVPILTGTSDTASFFFSGLPVALRPASLRLSNIPAVWDTGNAITDCYADIEDAASATGIINIYKYGGGSWNASGSKGNFAVLDIFYVLN